MKNLIAAFCLFCFALNLSAQKYPVTQKNPLEIKKYNIAYNDDYQWLEDVESEQVKNWSSAQYDSAIAFVESFDKKQRVAVKLDEYDDYTQNSLPQKIDHLFYQIYRYEDDGSVVLVYRKKLDGEATNLFKLRDIYPDKKAEISNFAPSKNARYLACEVSPDESKKNEIRFVDIGHQKVIEDKVTDIKGGRLAWYRDFGIFYRRKLKESIHDKDSIYNIYYHKIGTPEAEDKLVYNTAKTDIHYNFFTYDDKLYVFEYDLKTQIRKYYYSYLLDGDYRFEKFYESDDNFRYFCFYNNKIYFSKRNYDWGNLCSIDLNNNNVESVVIPQVYSHLLIGSYITDDYIFCKYLYKGNFYISTYDSSGNFIRKTFLPDAVTCSFEFYDELSKSLYLELKSYTLSRQNFKIDVVSGQSSDYFNPFLKAKPSLFSQDKFITQNITVKNRDLIDVPITLVYKKGLLLNGKNPTLLEGIGAFGNVKQPYYEPGLIYFLEKGGVYCVAHVRGSGYLGEKWHQNGKGFNKKNSINDFIDVAEYLIAQNYTSSAHLAAEGTLSDALMVSAAMIQKPELFKFVILFNGIYDLTKIKSMSPDSKHVLEFGDPDKLADFQNLLSYSPYNNLKENVNYPTVILTAEDESSRFPLFHSYKLTARLQNRFGQKNPICLFAHTRENHKEDSTKKKTYHRYSGVAKYYQSILDICGE